MDSIFWIVSVPGNTWMLRRPDLCTETTLSYASIMGIKPGLHLVGDNYQWLGSLFYFGMDDGSPY
jgi:hypothetical protein